MSLPPFDLDAVLAPVDEKHPAGAFDEEDNAFQEIDHEMVKLGASRKPIWIGALSTRPRAST
ncbi:hypothetical protein P4050_35545 [Pseudomonas aeruginosa]|nr:hypothetical protein [Pseudomonas aeruginosa]